jgi:hypothetical protein
MIPVLFHLGGYRASGFSGFLASKSLAPASDSGCFSRSSRVMGLLKSAYIFPMKLREHSKMSYRGRPSWPPTWTSGLTGEIGVLKEAYRSLVSTTRVFVTIDYVGDSYTGFIDLDDEQFCRQLVDLLQKHYGKTIRQIAELDIP